MAAGLPARLRLDAAGAEPSQQVVADVPSPVARGRRWDRLSVSGVLDRAVVVDDDRLTLEVAGGLLAQPSGEAIELRSRGFCCVRREHLDRLASREGLFSLGVSHGASRGGCTGDDGWDCRCQRAFGPAATVTAPAWPGGRWSANSAEGESRIWARRPLGRHGRAGSSNRRRAHTLR